MADLVQRFANDESGATAIEYGLIAAGISVAIITVVNTLGSLRAGNVPEFIAYAKSNPGKIGLEQLLKIQLSGNYSGQSRVDCRLRCFNWEQMMKKAFGYAAIAMTLVAITAPAEAKGCIKGGAFAGHHGVLGAAAGCAIGHHEANKQQKTQPRTTGNALQTAPR